MNNWNVTRNLEDERGKRNVVYGEALDRLFPATGFS